MEKSKRRFVILILVCFSILIAAASVIMNSKMQYPNWNACKKELINKYKFIDKIDIDGHGPSLVISVQIKNKVNSIEIEKVFNELINQPQAVYDDINSIHKKRAGYIEQIYIWFSAINSNREDSYQFYSVSKEGREPGFERFKFWKLEHGGLSIDYTPIKQ